MKPLPWSAAFVLICASSAADAQSRSEPPRAPTPAPSASVPSTAAPVPSGSKETPEVAAARIRRNREHEASIQFKKGVALSESHHPEEARIFYAEALAIYPTPLALWNLASSEYTSSHLLESLGHYREWLALPSGPDKTPALIADAQETIAELMADTAHFTISGVDSTLVTVDDIPLVKLPHESLTFDVLPGKHVLKAKVGPDEQVRTHEMTAGSTTAVKFGAAPVGQGQWVPSVPAPPNGGEPASGWSARTWTALGLGVASAALATGSVIYAVKAGTSADEVEHLRTPMARGACGSGCPAIDEGLRSTAASHTTSLVLGVSAALVGAGALGVALWPRSREERHAASPVIGPGFVGAQWSGRF